MSDIPDDLDYEQRVTAELEAAAIASTLDQRREHLNRAAVLAAEGEAARHKDPD